MDPSPIRRTFRNPGDVRGLPGVPKHRPIPARDTPLPGTKSLSCPKDESLKELISGRTVEVVLPSRTATIFGYLAVVCAVVGIALFWISGILGEEALSWLPETFLFFYVAIFHLLVIFSQILSSGRNRPGGIAILIFYGGMILSLVIDHLMA
jgi:hypothetical protein